MDYLITNMYRDFNVVFRDYHWKLENKLISFQLTVFHNNLHA